MIGPIFVDTNVLIYARDRKEEVKRLKAQAWLTTLNRLGLIRINLQILNEFTRVVLAREPRRSLPDVRREVDALRMWGEAPIVSDDVQLAWQVRAALGYQWFDCLLIAAARRSDCTHFLTEDMGGKAGARFGATTLIDPFVTPPTAIIPSN